jgi:mono/diheme cytochrome c family protein
MKLESGVEESDTLTTATSAKSGAEYTEVTVVNRVGSATFVLAVLLATGPVASAQDKARIERGTKVYADQKCSVCHAIGGKGNAKGPLDEVGSTLKAEEIHAWLVNAGEMTKTTTAERKPAMKAYTNLSKEDVDALVAYMVSLKRK